VVDAEYYLYMKTKLARIIRAYLDSYYLPAVVSVGATLVLVIPAYVDWNGLGVWPLYVYFASVLGVVFAATYSFAKRRSGRGVLHVVTLLVVAISTMVSGLLLGTVGDGFADHLTIPPHIAISDPGEEQQVESGATHPQIRPDKPTIMLRKSTQPGIYESEIWANPKEPGYVYLRAYEATHNTRLSSRRLWERSSKSIGWSKGSKELFLSSATVTISEGDWGKPYAARFEVWFVPDSGKPPRKLMQRVFKIEGWQR